MALSVMEAENRIKKVCVEKGYKFLGFGEKFRGCDTLVLLSCHTHGAWGTQKTRQIINGHPRECPLCCGNTTEKRKIEIKRITELSIKWAESQK